MLTDSQAVKRFIAAQFGENLPEGLRTQIKSACTASRLPKKTILFHEGEAGAQMFYLAEGQVKLYRMSEDGREALIHFVHPGQIFAEVVLKPRTPYPVTAETLEDCILVALAASRFFDIMHADRDFMQRFTAILTMRLTEFVQQIQSLSSQDVEGRLMSYFRGLADNKHTARVRLPVAKKNLALLLGTTPETLSRVLTRLADEGIIKTEKQYITIL